MLNTKLMPWNTYYHCVCTCRNNLQLDHRMSLVASLTLLSENLLRGTERE